jgi:glycosyltransferase involved in cell wall biosynthesis
MPPIVSIIIATYNRAAVLAFAIESVRRNTFTDWELLVVGDACTDDTRAVVERFQDPRISFINLPANCGEQSGPNNAGVARATGQYLAFLSHDDFWLPDHLATLVAEIERQGADLVFGLALQRRPDGLYSLPAASPSGHYEPQQGVAATLWLFRRELASEIGPWCSFRETYMVPSQEWLYRAWRAGKKMIMVPTVTALILPSGSRPNCYAETQSAEHQALFERLTADATYRRRLLNDALVQFAQERHQLTLWPPLRAVAKRLYYRLVLALGMHPLAISGALRFGRKGGRIHWLRQIRGLPAIK